MSIQYDTAYCDNIVCPHCGYEDRDSWEVNAGGGLEWDEASLECNSCGKKMKASKHCTITYSTEKLK